MLYVTDKFPLGDYFHLFNSPQLLQWDVSTSRSFLSLRDTAKVREVEQPSQQSQDLLFLLRPGFIEAWLYCRKLLASDIALTMEQIWSKSMPCCEWWKLHVAALCLQHQRDLLSGRKTQEVENNRTSSLKILFHLLSCHCVILTDYRWFCYKELRHLGDQPAYAKSSLYLHGKVAFFFYTASFLIPVRTESIDTKRLLFKIWDELLDCISFKSNGFIKKGTENGTLYIANYRHLNTLQSFAISLYVNVQSKPVFTSE